MVPVRWRQRHNTQRERISATGSHSDSRLPASGFQSEVDNASPRVLPLMVDQFAMLRILAGLLLCAGSLAAQTTLIRLGTLVPKDSRWYELLVKMGEDWNKASGGKIKLD